MLSFRRVGSLREVAVLLGALWPALACGGGSGDVSAGPLVQHDTIGDTVVVRTVSGSVCGEPRELVPEITIWVLEGDQHYMFGNLRSLAVGPDGTIYAMDAQIPAVRVYGSDGVYRATLGRDGGGPGEFARPDGGMTTLSDGRLVVRDPGNARLQVFSAAGEPGGVYLDYLVAENKPITAYFQASNTGTKGTTDWRQRFGFAHNQLTGRDDILRFDYITGSFDKVNAVFSSYDFPLIGIDRLRGNVGGSWSEYDSSQFGFVLSRFTGDQWDVSGELEANIFQYGDFFADLFAGIRYQGVNINNQIVPGFNIKADSQYFFPTVGLRFERQTDTSQLNGALLNDWNAPGVTGVSSADMALMGGAANPALYDTSFAILRWETYASTYLEPILNPAGYHDPSTHWSSTQAHEVYLGFRGQYAYNDHLIPQHQMVAGGYHTVRGYPQSSVAGDNVYFGRA